VSIFTIIPNELIADHGLTLIETRVLCALYSFRDPKSTRPVWPGRRAISERCGYHPDVISRTTTSLERKGWLKKIRRGKKQSNYYEILGKSDLTDPVSTPETITKSDATELVRCDLTEPVASIRTDHLTDHNNRRANGNLAKSAAGRAKLAELRIVGDTPEGDR